MGFPGCNLQILQPSCFPAAPENTQPLPARAFPQSNGNAHPTIADDPAAFVLPAMQQVYCEQQISMILGVFVQTWRNHLLEINFFVAFI